MAQPVFLFTRSPLWGSRLIRWGTNAPVSHVAIYYPGDEVVLHSTHLGVHAIHLKEFLTQAQIVYRVTWNDYLLPWPTLLLRFNTKGYDYRGLLFLAFSILFTKITGKKSKILNRWGQADAYMCTEFASLVAFGKNDDTITPYELYLKIKAHTERESNE